MRQMPPKSRKPALNQVPSIRAQVPVKISDEITKAIQNYDKIVEAVRKHDPEKESRFARGLIGALHEDCLPPLKTAIEKIKQAQPRITDFEDSFAELESKVREFRSSDDNKIDESLLVLLLYLIIEKGALSVSRKNLSIDGKDSWANRGNPLSDKEN